MHQSSISTQILLYLWRGHLGEKANPYLYVYLLCALTIEKQPPAQL
ncbi:hypothetical protein NVIRPANT_00867 [Pantoea sp. Nvir]|nr:hypothetical protein NVIRPANT_00867 [Pantoea sp. Nvir]